MNELIEDYQRKINSVNELLKNKDNDKETINRLKIKVGCYRSFLTDLNRALNIDLVSKSYYWLKADGTISNMWNEEDHKKYISEQDIKDAEKNGWQLIQINVC